MDITEHTIDLAGEPVFYRTAGEAPGPVYLHSIPTSSDDWTPFLARTGGLAPDLPGFGRSGKGGHLAYTLADHIDFLGAFLRAAEAGPEPLSLVGHGWGGAIALGFSQRHPERVGRLVLIDPVPLLPDFAWPAVVRRLGRPVVGELVLGALGKRALSRVLRAGATTPEAWSAQRLSAVWDQFDQGTQRAILRLVRACGADVLAAAGGRLHEIGAPALILWGEHDPWLDPSFGSVYTALLARATLELVPGAGHWPWLDRSETVERTAAFLGVSGS